MNLNMRLYKKLPFGVWYVEFERGKRRSLKTKDKSEATALFREVKRQYLAGRLWSSGFGRDPTLEHRVSGGA